MVTTNSHMVSADKRDLGMRARPDLIVKRNATQGEYCWIVKDPLAMKYFRLRKAEYLVLKALEQPVSYDDLKRLLTQEFPEQYVRLEAIQHLVAHLHKSGLLIAESSGQSKQLGKRRDKVQLQKIIRAAMSVYSLKLPGFDPDRFLGWLYPKFRFFFTGWFTTVVLLTILAALTLVGTNYQTFHAKLPEFSQFFSFENLLLMTGLLIFTKSIHEMGHALMCKHFGGECHQIGFMLMVLTPAMYCDTSDSWMLRNRWHRMAIGAAGMYFEMFVAAVCTFIWWFTHPGWIHYMSLNIMILSSVTTFLFNANPLLRYDGYYILSDFWEIPNLAQKANLQILSQIRQWTLGMKPIAPHLLAAHKQRRISLYAVAAVIYRVFIMFCIVWFISNALEPYGLEVFAHLFIALSLTGLVVVPMFKLIKFFSFPGRFRDVNRTRFGMTCLLSCLAVLVIGFLPLPHYLWAHFVVRPLQADSLVLSHAGRLTEVCAREGEHVQSGQIIARLENSELMLRLEELKGRLARLQSDRLAFEQMSTKEFNAAGKLAETVAEIRSVQRQLSFMQQKSDGLVIRAQRSGQLYAPRNIPDSYQDEATLKSWTNTPLAAENQGTYLEENTLLGSVGKPNEIELALVVHESEVEFLKSGQSVTALLRPFGSEFLRGELTGISEDELKLVPRELSQTNQGPIPVEPDSDGNERPLLRSYEAYVNLPTAAVDASEIRLIPGAIGQARIHVGSSSLGSRLLRYLSAVVRFR